VAVEVYQDILMQFIALLEVNDAGFQQDGATCHTAGKTMELLRERFGEKLISNGLCPPRSAELPTPDFFLRGHLKGHAFNSNPHTTEDMKTNISEATASINQRNPSSSGIEYGETREWLHSGEWWALPALL
jgi:hypothetical protein